MTSEECIGWRVPAGEYEKFLRFVESERGNRDRYAWVFIENSIREYIDADDLRELEQLVDSVLRAGGYTPSERPPKKEKSSASETLRGEDTTLVNRRIDADLRERFMSFVKEHTEFGTRYGLALGYALREYRQSNRVERTTEKFARVSADISQIVADLGESQTTDGLSTKEKRTVAMCREIHDLPLTVGVQPLPRRDIHAAIESVMRSLTDYLKETYTPLILDRIEYEPSPSNANLFLPIGDAEQQRREDAETEATQQMDVLTQSIPATDGGTSN